MHCALNEDQIAGRDRARDFAAEQIAPHALRSNEEKHFPLDGLCEAPKLATGGVSIHDGVGGSGLSWPDAALIFEALARGRPTAPALISIHNMVAIDAFGNEAQRKRFLPKLRTIAGLASHCPTEPGSGPDATLRSRAVRGGKHHVLDGQFISGTGGGERIVRELRAHRILQGTNEIMRPIVARKMIEGAR